jgi:excisionase family DNA binding protein
MVEMKSTAQAAREIGVSKGTLLRWLHDGVLREPKRIDLAGSAWRAWIEADIERARRVKATMRRGPKPKGRKKGARR